MPRGGAIGLGASGGHEYAQMVGATYLAAMTRACPAECGRLSDRGPLSAGDAGSPHLPRILPCHSCAYLPILLALRGTGVTRNAM